jgi:hypothetical protein
MSSNNNDKRNEDNTVRKFYLDFFTAELSAHTRL